VLEIVQNMKATFSETAYHLVHRNCNHFTETFATALLKYEDLMEGKPLLGRLNVYPVYVNRLATTGATFVGHDDDIVVRVSTLAALSLWNLNCNKMTRRLTLFLFLQNTAMQRFGGSYLGGWSREKDRMEPHNIKVTKRRHKEIKARRKKGSHGSPKEGAG
jgi:hypothetical protein